MIYLFISLLSFAICNDNLELNLLVPADMLKITKGGKAIADEKQMYSKSFSETNSKVYTDKGEDPYYFMEVKTNSNGSINSITGAVPQARRYQTLKFDSQGKLISKADCYHFGTEMNCNIIVPKFCREFLAKSDVRNFNELREKVKTCKKLTVYFERAKAVEAKADMNAALRDTSSAIRSSNLRNMNDSFKTDSASDFKLNDTGDVELGILDMAEMAEDCARFEEQELFPPKAAGNKNSASASQ